MGVKYCWSESPGRCALHTNAATFLSNWSIQKLGKTPNRLVNYNRTCYTPLSTQLGLKCIHVAGSALTDEIRSQVEKKFLTHQKIQPAIGQFFGSTELNMTGLGTVWSSYEGRNCVGRIWSSRDYKFRVQNAGKECESNEEGDIWILSPNRMQNYLHDKEKPAVEWIDMGDS